MNKSELIHKWQGKYFSMLKEYNDRHRGSENSLAQQLCRAQMKNVLEFIEDVKQLNETPVI